MKHDEAIRLMGAEQYFLNELSPELREQFEEHFFECPECAADMRAGSLFIEHSKAILAADAAVPQQAIAASGTQKQSWWAWLRPAVAVPVIALLLAVVAYQNWPSPRTPQVLPAAYLTIGSRGASVPSISTPRDQGFLLRVGVPPENGYFSYSAEIYAPDGKMLSSVKLPNSQDTDNYFIQVPPGSYNDGTYSVAIRGARPDGSSDELGRSSFEVHILR
jgi:anti-sigma factor RsiW